MADDIKQFAQQLRTDLGEGRRLDGQVKSPAAFWIEIAKLGSGWAAIMLWDGMGYPEPWETGDGRYGEPEPAACEARAWAAAEGVEFREHAPGS